MALPNVAMFPDNTAPALGDLTNPGQVLQKLFEFREGVIRSLAAHNFLGAYRGSTAPVAPTPWLIWINPAVLSGTTFGGADIKIWDGAAWQNMTPALFAQAIVTLGGGAATSSFAAGSIV